jgi:hypothetical protein
LKLIYPSASSLNKPHWWIHLLRDMIMMIDPFRSRAHFSGHAAIERGWLAKMAHKVFKSMLHC